MSAQSKHSTDDILVDKTQRPVTVTIEGYMSGCVQDIALEVADRLEDSETLHWSLGTVIVETPGEYKEAPTIEAIDREEAWMTTSSDWPEDEFAEDDT